MRTISHFINGQSVTRADAVTSPVYDPSTGEVQARLQHGDAAILAEAIAVAKAAQPAWAAINPQRRARAQPGLANTLQHPVDVPGRLDMDGQGGGARIAKGFDGPFRVLDHQVDVEGELRVTPAVLDRAWAHRDRRDEVPIHHVEMHPIGTGLLQGGDLLTQPAEIGRKQRRRD